MIDGPLPGDLKGEWLARKQANVYRDRDRTDGLAYLCHAVLFPYLFVAAQPTRQKVKNRRYDMAPIIKGFCTFDAGIPHFLPFLRIVNQRHNRLSHMVKVHVAVMLQQDIRRNCLLRSNTGMPDQDQTRGR